MAYERKQFNTIAGATVYLELEHDPWTTPQDDDGLSPKQIKAWEQDKWFYVTAEVSIVYEGIVLGTGSYGGIEYGLFTYTDDEDNITKEAWISIEDIWEYVGNELEGEAMWNAREAVKTMTKWLEVADAN